MKTIQLTNKQIDILEDLLLCTLEEETDNTSLSRDEEYIKDLKEIYNEYASISKCFAYFALFIKTL